MTTTDSEQRTQERRQAKTLDTKMAAASRRAAAGSDVKQVNLRTVLFSNQRRVKWRAKQNRLWRQALQRPVVELILKVIYRFSLRNLKHTNAQIIK